MFHVRLMDVPVIPKEDVVFWKVILLQKVGVVVGEELLPIHACFPHRVLSQHSRYMSVSVLDVPHKLNGVASPVLPRRDDSSRGNHRVRIKDNPITDFNTLHDHRVIPHKYILTQLARIKSAPSLNDGVLADKKVRGKACGQARGCVQDTVLSDDDVAVKHDHVHVASNDRSVPDGDLSAYGYVPYNCSVGGHEELFPEDV